MRGVSGGRGVEAAAGSPLHRVTGTEPLLVQQASGQVGERDCERGGEGRLRRGRDEVSGDGCLAGKWVPRKRAR